MKNVKARKRPLKVSAPAPAKEPRKKLIGITEDSATRFFAELRKGFSVLVACERSGVKRATAYDLRRADAGFRAGWDEAVEEGTDRIEDEALRRAIAGSERPIYQGGKHVGSERVYSDRLIELLLKARRPKKYRERVEHKHGGDGQGGGIPIDIKGLTNEQLEAFKRRIAAGLGVTVAAVTVAAGSRPDSGDRG